MNSSIKRYVDAKSELSALIRLIEDLEREYYFEDPLGASSNTIQDKYSNKPLCADLKGSLSPIIYKKHLNQFQNAANYSNETVLDDEHQTIYHVWHDKFRSEEEKLKKMEKIIWKKKKLEFKCTGELLETEGILCRHVFHIARIKNMKTLSDSVHQRWTNKVIALSHDFPQGEKEKIVLEEKAMMKKEEEEEKKRLENEKLRNERIEEDSIDQENEHENGSLGSMELEEPNKSLPNFQKKESGKGRRTRKSDEVDDMQDGRSLKKSKR